MYEPPPSITDLTEHTVPGGLLDPGLKYVWRTGYEDSSGNITYSDLYTFKIGTSVAESLPQVYAGVSIKAYDMVSFVHPGRVLPDPEEVISRLFLCRGFRGSHGFIAFD